MIAKRIPLISNRPPPSGVGVRNQILAALPDEEYSRVASTLDIVPLKLKQFLYKPREPIQHVYFPGGGFCSVVTVLNNGDMIEVTTIGREGMVGASAVLNGDPSPAATLVQGETDTCYRMPVAAFRNEIDRGAAFSVLLKRYVQALGGIVMQSTACNAVHSIDWIDHVPPRPRHDR